MACYLIDLDGTIYCGPRPLPYAAEFIRRLNRAGRPYRFLTNAPERSPRLVERELRRMGIPVCGNEAPVTDKTKPPARQRRAGGRLELVVGLEPTTAGCW